MALVHAAIGLGEALITGMVVRFVLLARPDLIHEAEAEPAVVPRAARCGRVAACGLGIALAVAVFLAPFASSAPDGLEWVGTQKAQFLKDEAPSVIAAPVPDYEMPGLRGAAGLATAAAGALGTLVVFAAGLGLARAFRDKPAIAAPELVS
jgi:cobalt/nickel transport system permease protein